MSVTKEMYETTVAQKQEKVYTKTPNRHKI